MADHPNALDGALPAVMGPPESRDYWDRRHGAGSDLRSGGNASYDEAMNAMLYAVRTARLVEALGAATDVLAPLRVLDAGCGKGYFSRALTRFGHRVDGIDTSPIAIAVCRNQAVGPDTYAVSALRDWQPPWLYDAVVCVDVLFHLMEDEEWEASVTNLAQLVRLGGRVVLADHDADIDRAWSTYQRTRATSRYHALLTGRGFEVNGFIPNAFRDDAVGMHVATRVA